LYVGKVRTLATSNTDFTTPVGSVEPFFVVALQLSFSPSTGTAFFASRENLLS
jgi:hypothetical protein